jgi:thiol-disulfide isomerase/thioredoxin
MLENIQTGAYNLVTNTRFWMILVVIIFFLIVAGYVYNKYVTPMVDAKFIPNNEFHGQGTVGGSTTDAIQEVELYIFTVGWCPHSKKAIPIWNQLKDEYDNKPYNGYKINFIQVDGEESPDLADKYKVEGYPTIKLVKGNQIIEYDAKPSVAHLKEFLNSTLS